MESMAGKSGLLLAILLGAIGAYILAAVDHHEWPVFVLVSLFLIGVALLLIGWWLMSRNPVGAVAFIQWSILATVSAGITLFAVGLWCEELARRHFAPLPSDERDTLIRVSSLAISAFIGFFFASRITDPLSFAFPAGQTKYIFKKAFGNQVASGGSDHYNALYEDDIASPSISGWGRKARKGRAQILATPARQSAPAPPPNDAPAPAPRPEAPK